MNLTATTPPVYGTTTVVWEGYVRADEALPGDMSFPYGLIENTVRLAGGFEITFAAGGSDYFLDDETLYVERTVVVTVSPVD